MSRTKPAKPQGDNAALREKVARMKGKLDALETTLNEMRALQQNLTQRLFKVETAVAGPQTPDVAGDVTNSEPQMPQTE